MLAVVGSVNCGDDEPVRTTGDDCIDADLDHICDDYDIKVCVDEDEDNICDGFEGPTPAPTATRMAGDMVCDSNDLCFGDDATGDTDDDGICDNTEALGPVVNLKATVAGMAAAVGWDNPTGATFEEVLSGAHTTGLVAAGPQAGDLSVDLTTGVVTVKNMSTGWAVSGVGTYMGGTALAVAGGGAGSTGASRLFLQPSRKRVALFKSTSFLAHTFQLTSKQRVARRLAIGSIV